MNEQELDSLRALAQQRHPTDSHGGFVFRAIIESTAIAFGIAPSEITGRDRHKSIAEARAVVCYVARRCTKMSFPEIGRALGNRDHTTIMTACKRVSLRRQRDRWTDSACAVLLEQFGTAEGSRTQ